MLYKCVECNCVHNEKVDECEGCREKEFEEVELDEEIVSFLIRDYSWRDPSDSVTIDSLEDDLNDYLNDELDWDLFNAGMKLAKKEGWAVTYEVVYFPD